MNSPQPEILYGLFCEFVRVEKSGQVSPVGIWGESCLLETKAPGTFPQLTFYSLIRNHGHLSYKAKLRVTLPGRPTPIELEISAKGDPLQLSQNLIFNLMGVPISESGDVVALLQLDTGPPLEREFRLHVDFRPQVTP